MSTPATVLSLLFLASTPEPLPPRPASEQMSGAPPITGTGDTPPPPREVRIKPGQGLLLVFDTPIQREGLAIDARESFRQVTLSEDGLLLTLMPSTKFPLGRRLRLTTPFPAQ